MTRDLGIKEFYWADGNKPTKYTPAEGHRIVWSTNPMWLNEYAKNDKGEDIIVAQHNIKHISTIVFQNP
jgi:hypothetical protein